MTRSQDATPSDFAMRLERLEQAFRTLEDRMPSNTTASTDLADQISFRAWMRISAPTLAITVFGFTLLWNAQQASSAQLLEMNRSLGRLDGAVERLDGSVARIDERLHEIDERLLGIDERLLGIDDRLEGIDERLGSLDGTLTTFGASVAKLASAVDRLADEPRR